MIYLYRYTLDAGQLIAEIAVVEAPDKAATYEALGYTRCDCAELRAAWRSRDQARLAELATEAQRRAPVVVDEAGDVWAVGHIV